MTIKRKNNRNYEQERQARPKTKRPPIETLADLYSKHTTREIANMFSVPENTVKSWIYRYRHPYEKVGVRNDG